MLYRVKLSARRHASFLPEVHKSGRPMGLVHLHHPTGAHVTVCVCAALLASTSRAVTRTPRSGLSPLIHVVRSTGSFATRVRFVFAPVHRHSGAGGHGINSRDYSIHWRQMVLLRLLPLARSELHYEHCAPHDYPLARGPVTDWQIVRWFRRWRAGTIAVAMVRCWRTVMPVRIRSVWPTYV